MIHFIGGEKGGVGKSVVSRCLAQYFIDNNRSFMGYDADRSHQSFLRFYEDFGLPLNIDSFDGLDSMIESFPEGGKDEILIDLAAQSIQPLMKWIQESDVVQISSDLGITLNFWHVMDDSRDSVHLLEKLIHSFDERVKIIPVLNYGRGLDFSILESSHVKDLMIQKNIPVIRINKLYEKTMQKIDRDNISFWAAIHNTDLSLGLFERQRVKSWLKNVYGEFIKYNI